MEAFKNMRLVDRVTSVLALVALLVVFFWAPGAHAQSGNVYASGQRQTISSSEEGVVLQVAIKRVEAEGTTNMVGTAVGGVLGGLLMGSNQNQDWQTRTAAGLLGTTIGGLLGNKVTSSVYAKDAQEIVVGLRDPKTGDLTRVITVVQPEPFDAVQENDNVLIVNTNGSIRIIKRRYDPARYSQR